MEVSLMCNQQLNYELVIDDTNEQRDNESSEDEQRHRKLIFIWSLLTEVAQN